MKQSLLEERLYVFALEIVGLNKTLPKQNEYVYAE